MLIKFKTLSSKSQSQSDTFDDLERDIDSND